MVKIPPVLRVLVVDDEPLIRWSLVETLSDRGHVVTEAADAASTRLAERGAAEPHDVVLLEFRLPDSNDLGLLATIRQEAPQAQVIVMTAHGTPEMTRGALELGAYRVIAKPFEVAQLAELVAEAAARR